MPNNPLSQFFGGGRQMGQQTGQAMMDYIREQQALGPPSPEEMRQLALQIAMGPLSQADIIKAMPKGFPYPGRVIDLFNKYPAIMKWMEKVETKPGVRGGEYSPKAFYSKEGAPKAWVGGAESHEGWLSTLLHETFGHGGQERIYQKAIPKHIARDWERYTPEEKELGLVELYMRGKYAPPDEKLADAISRVLQEEMGLTPYDWEPYLMKAPPKSYAAYIKQAKNILAQLLRAE